MDQNAERTNIDQDAGASTARDGEVPEIGQPQEKNVIRKGKFSALLIPAVLIVIVLVGLVLVFVLIPGKDSSGAQAAGAASTGTGSQNSQSGVISDVASGTSGSAAASAAAPAAAPAADSSATGPTAAPSTVQSAQNNTSASDPGSTGSASTAGTGSTAAATAPGTSDQQPAFDITTRTDQPPMTDEAAFTAWMVKNYPEPDKAEYLTLLHDKWVRMEAIRSRGDATNPRILEAFLRAPREFFSRDIPRSYDDAAMPIGYGQTISGPHLVSHMTEALDPQPDQKVLEIGTGSGYQSSVLSELSNHVFTIEIVPQLYQQTDAIYTKHSAEYPEFRNIHRKNADGYYGWAEYAPFDRIIVTCGIDHIPPDLLKQLAPGGIMVIPVGPPSGQTVLKITKEVNPDGSITLKREDIYHGRRSVIFVPFTSKSGLHTVQSDNVSPDSTASGASAGDSSSAGSSSGAASTGNN